LTTTAPSAPFRPVASARKSWLFFGSDDHAEAAANLFSLVASCKLHGLDPEAYLRDVIRVMAHWPRDRYLELSPLHWRSARGRLLPDELAREYGPLTVPAPREAERQGRERLIGERPSRTTSWRSRRDLSRTGLMQRLRRKRP
jgi:transposase